MNTGVPKEAINIYNRALELTNRNQIAEALEEYKKAVELYPDFLEAYTNMGQLYSHMEERDEAIACYNRALKIDRNFRVLLNIGVEHYNHGDMKSALDFFLEAVKKKKDFIEGNFYAGLVHYNQKDLKKAEPFFKKVTLSDPKHLKAHYLLSYIYYEWKDYKATLECLDIIADRSEDRHFINRYYGFCYYYLGDYDRAVKYLQEAIESRPEYARFKKYLESISYENKVKEVGDVDKAISELEGTIMHDKPVLSEVTRLSMLYIFKGENKKAEKLLLDTKKRIAS